MNDGVDSEIHDGIEQQKAGEWVRAALARIAPSGAEKLRQLNEESRREAMEAEGGRRLRPEWHKNGQPVDRLNMRSACT